MPAILQLAFRPFFLLAAGCSVVAVGLWAGHWSGLLVLQPHGGALWWHQHEMLFGFALAVIAGFLLTAVQTWTGQRSVHGPALLSLVLLWLTARLLLLFPADVPALLLLLIDVAFPVCVAIALARRVLAVRQWRNLGFVPILLGLAICSAATHLALLQQDPGLATAGNRLALLLIAGLIMLVGGRVIPLFTANRLQAPRAPRYPALELAALTSLLALLGAEFLRYWQPDLAAMFIGPLGLLAALINGIRLLGWRGWQAWREPMLWSLHLAYAWVPIGLGLWGLAAWLPAVSSSMATHALGVGAIGTLILTFMTRVSLGHTGRPVETPTGMALGVLLLTLTALLRVLAPPIGLWVQLAAAGWIVGYLLFLWHALPLLTRPRPDGRLG